MLFLLLVTAPLLCGCANYAVGNATLFPTEIRTVHVEMFRSNSFRRNMGERLTEAVAKRIEEVSTMKIADAATADSILTGTIISDTKRIVVESPTDEGRQIQTNYRVEVTWQDRSGNSLQSSTIDVPAELVIVAQTGNTTPEVGQSIVTGQQVAIDRLARQIVAMMERPW
ncbi:MAG: LPS assembly lipoprotein LptE [Pirellulales bacterium]